MLETSDFRGLSFCTAKKELLLEISSRRDSKCGSSEGMFPVKGLGADVPGLGIYGRAHSGEALAIRYERDGGSAVWCHGVACGLVARKDSI